MLYFFFVFKFMRGIITSNFQKIQEVWYEDIPNPDRIYIMLNYIYYLRSCKLYDWEEVMYSKLIFLIRSKELVIKMTRFYGDPYDPNFIFQDNRSKYGIRFIISFRSVKNENIGIFELTLNLIIRKKPTVLVESNIRIYSPEIN